MNKLWSKYDENESTCGSSDRLGVVYAIEYGDYIKVGSTSNLQKRYQQLKKQAYDYCDVKIGKCYFTTPHEMYRRSERELHLLLKEFRKPKTELFNISLQKFFEYTKLYKPDMSKIDTSKSDAFIENLKIQLGMKHDNVIELPIDKNETDCIFREKFCAFCNDDEFLEVMNIVSLINKSANDSLLFNYLLIKMENIIKVSNERYLQKALSMPRK